MINRNDIIRTLEVRIKILTKQINLEKDLGIKQYYLGKIASLQDTIELLKYPEYEQRSES